jgi:hypothetical protein
MLKGGILYFAMVFGAGFVLGLIRIRCVVPLLGTRVAELLEAPLMLVIPIMAAQWIVRRLAVPHKLASRLGMGAIAVSLMLVGEFTLVLWLRGLTMSQYIASRDARGGDGLLPNARSVRYHAAPGGPEMKRAPRNVESGGRRVWCSPCAGFS